MVILLKRRLGWSDRDWIYDRADYLPLVRFRWLNHLDLLFRDVRRCVVAARFHRLLELVPSVDLTVVVFFDHVALGWRDQFVGQSQIDGNGFDIKANHSCETVHTEVSWIYIWWHFWLVVEEVNDGVILVVTVLSLLNSIRKPSFRIPAELIGVLCLQDLSGESHRGPHAWMVLLQFLRELVVLLFSVPIPFVNLLQFQSSVFGELLQLALRWLSFWVLEAFLEFVNLVSRFTGPFHANKGRSVFRLLLAEDDWCLFFSLLHFFFNNSLRIRINLSLLGHGHFGMRPPGAHDSLWHQRVSHEYAWACSRCWWLLHIQS